MNFRQVHLDFHTSEKIPSVGENFNKKEFQQALIEGHINSITLFSKCHHGWSYHPTKANEMHPNLKFDLLGAQIEAAHEIGVKTPVYVSGGLDEKYAVRHPEWLIVREDGTHTWVKDFLVPGFHRFCVNSPYMDYLLSHIKEVCENYDADGIFVDIAGVIPCYCNRCIKAVEERGGSRFNRDDMLKQAEINYKNYADRIRETIDSVKPGLPVFHNGGHIRIGRRDIIESNTHLEIESLPTGGWGYDHFPFSARYVQNVNKEYLGMTGKFHTRWGEFGGFKHPNALRYEVSLAAANGAKCSIGDQLSPDGKPDMATYKLIGKAYSELEKKEEWLDNVTQVTDIAVISYEMYSGSLGTGQSTKTTRADTGVSRILLEGKYLFDVIDMECDFNKYKVIILPDLIRITPAIKEKLDTFLAAGGKILATGKSGLSDTADEFTYDFGVKYIGESEYNPDYLKIEFEEDGIFETSYVMYSQGENVELTTGIELGKREKPFFNRTAQHFCSHIHTPNSKEYMGAGISMGKDGIYIGWQVFSEYAEMGSLITKKIVVHALDLLLGEMKTLRTNLGAQGITTLMEQPGRLINHLLYASPVKRGNGIEIIEDILPVTDTFVSIKTDKDIKKVYLAPQRKEIPFKKNNGRIEYTVDKFECHQMVVMEY